MGGSHALPRALPVAATRFVGRRQEIAATRRLLTSSRLVTLAGPPGVGKTRLALRVAEEVAHRFRGGVVMAELGGLRDPSLLAHEVARAIGLHDASTRWAVETLASHLGQRRVLLLLDNCEHLLDACAVLVDSLLRSCPRLQVLVTSRQSLGIPGEAVWRVPPLSLPAKGSVEGEAVELLVARAASAGAGHEFERDQMDAAAELCRRLDGLPLAIELAAVRLKTLTMRQVLDRLGNRFAVLGGAERAAPPHHRTLRAALDWSYALSTEEERILWQRLSVFPGSFDLSAVESVCVGDPVRADDVLDVLDGLVDKSLISATRSGPEMRYFMLESVRDFGLEKLRSDGDEVALRTRHRDHYARLCGEASTHLTDASQPLWFDQLETNYHNLRAALDWCLERGEPEIGCAMASDMWLYWEARGHLTEGRRRFAVLLDARESHDHVRARALWVAGYLALGQTDFEPAKPLLQESLDVATKVGDRGSAAFATQYLGLCRLFAGDFTGAAELFGQALEMHQTIGQPAAAFTLSDLAATAMLRGNHGDAIRLYERALAMTDQSGDPWTRSHSMWGLGVATWLEGDASRAEEAMKEALRLAGEVDVRTSMALCLEALAWISASRRDFERSARLQGAALSVWESVPRRVPEPLQEHSSRCHELTQAALEGERHTRLFMEGRALDRARAVALGLGWQQQKDKTRGGDSPVLSRRELEVAELVAKGMSDREIAAELVVAQRTAESHVQHILTKLGFKSRSQIATWVTSSKDTQRERHLAPR
jgi:predicted ATPase/DNA-binding CsgD family transcriptional regulator/Tfp pilus assembly protein PilF